MKNSYQTEKFPQSIMTFLSAQDTIHLKAHFITTRYHEGYFELFRLYFIPTHHICYPAKTNLFKAINPKILKTNQNVQKIMIYCKELSFDVKLIKILSDFGGRGLPA